MAHQTSKRMLFHWGIKYGNFPESAALLWLQWVPWQPKSFFPSLCSSLALAVMISLAITIPTALCQGKISLPL
jgi:hypothetical protein